MTFGKWEVDKQIRISGEPYKDYARIDLDLGASQNVGTNIELHLEGDYLAKISYNGSDDGCYFRFNQRHAAKVYANEFKKAKKRFNKIYLTNPTAQTGKHLVLQINNLDISEIEPDIKGTLEHLSEIEDAAESIEAVITTSGVMYEKQVTTGATGAVVEATTLMLNDVVVKNNHATVTSVIGDSENQRFELEPGDATGFTLLDLHTLYTKRVGGTNGTLVIIGSVR